MKNERLYSSYKMLNHSEEEKVFLDESNKFYSRLANLIITRMGLSGRVQHKMQYWFQVTNLYTSGHVEHEHFSGNEIFSFVHFIQVDENSPCFTWVMSEPANNWKPGEKNGDIIVFPPWAAHKVDRPSSKTKRIVVAGNIVLTKYRKLGSNKVFEINAENEQCIYTPVGVAK